MLAWYGVACVGLPVSTQAMPSRDLMSNLYKDGVVNELHIQIQDRLFISGSFAIWKRKKAFSVLGQTRC